MPHAKTTAWGFFIFACEFLIMTSAEHIYSLFKHFPGISTDSRNVARDSLFFAIRGEKFDGNRFAAEALDKGARYAIVDDPEVVTGESFILVPDVLEALQQLSVNHRVNTRAKIIGITGSNGKTTTKELIGRVLSSTYNTIVTRGNLNNHIGVPLTLLSIQDDTDFAVIEMGANHQGEIAGLCRLAQPGFGIITNIGKAHLDGFGGFEGVVKAKSELYDFIREHNGHLFVNNDNPLLRKLSTGVSSSGYGTTQNTFCKGKILEKEPFLKIAWASVNHEAIVNTRLYGDYNFENILASVCIGLYFGVTPEKINEAVSGYVPDNNRSQLIRTDRNTLVLDAYNANPSSMKAALLHFSQADVPAKMVVLGDMMELGDYSMEEHKNLAALADELHFEKLFFIGEFFSEAAGSSKENFFRNINEAEAWFREHPVRDMTILLKGSRKMKLETLCKLF
jgi:UDP-N-acetylmuramoyl-tripeptide--D-alanyl-D-alanine ligase